MARPKHLEGVVAPQNILLDESARRALDALLHRCPGASISEIVRSALLSREGQEGALRDFELRARITILEGEVQELGAALADAQKHHGAIQTNLGGIRDTLGDSPVLGKVSKDLAHDVSVIARRWPEWGPGIEVHVREEAGDAIPLHHDLPPHVHAAARAAGSWTRLHALCRQARGAA